MGFIVQMQRRAIEQLKEEGPPLVFSTGEVRFLLENGRELHFLGRSKGVGTCSDIHGMDVLVVSEVHGNGRKPPVSSWSVAYAVLLRDPTAEEIRQNHNLDETCLEAVELLQLVAQNGSNFTFRKTGRSSCYVRT